MVNREPPPAVDSRCQMVAAVVSLRPGGIRTTTVPSAGAASISSSGPVAFGVS